MFKTHTTFFCIGFISLVNQDCGMLQQEVHFDWLINTVGPVSQ